MKFSLAFGLSLLAHGIVILSWAGADSAEFGINSTPAAYQITLLNPPQKKIKKVQAKKITIASQKKSALSSRNSIKTVQPEKYLTSNTFRHTEAEVRTRTEAETRTEAKTRTRTEAESETRAYVVSRINREMKNHFSYPLIAQRNGWQGKVVLGLLVDSQGSIDHVHIEAASGYRILDQSALNALLKIRQIEKPDSGSYLQDLEIFIPVIYRLQKG